MHVNLKQKSNKKIDMHKIFTKLVGICIHSNNIKNTTLEFGKNVFANCKSKLGSITCLDACMQVAHTFAFYPTNM
jgi:hypothetical protein